MNAASDLSRKIARALAVAWKVVVGVLAMLGLFWLTGEPFLRLLTEPLFETQVTRRAFSPGGQAFAKVVLRTGGLGTVSTVRVELHHADGRAWTVYRTQDSEFKPQLLWLNEHTLLIVVPCGRFDHISNPDDWEHEWAPRPDRLKVRFTRHSDCE